MKRTSCRDFARIVRATRGDEAPLPWTPLPSSLFMNQKSTRNVNRGLSQNQPHRFHLNSEPRHFHPTTGDGLAPPL